MKMIKYILVFLLITISVGAQVIPKDTIKSGYVLTEKDTILADTIHLEEIVIYKEKLSPEAQKQFLLLRNRVYITYPYAKLASERLTSLNKGMASLTNNKDKKKYFKIVEDYLTNEFEAKLKKLSRKQGQILVKLIHRQTGVTTYELIRNLKSGWKAFWSNTAARMFDINLKIPYAPYQDNEDFLIETILVRAFESGRLINQPPVTPIDYNNLNDFWVDKAIKTNK
jgi:Domain of unknown function (DUF4294)